MEEWAGRYDFKSVVDVACGTGLHSIILAEKGFSVTGADLSPSMIEKAIENSRKRNVNIPFFQVSMDKLGEVLKDKFDFLLCLGNSIPHITEKEVLKNVFRSFFSILNPGGTFVIQLLNYHKVYKTDNRIVGVHRKGNKEFIRFYDLSHDYLVFNNLIVKWNGDKCTHNLHSTILHPYRKEDLEKALASEGFCDFEFYGDMKFSDFDKEASSNLVIVGKKNV